jgi:hypothetical protein
MYEVRLIGTLTQWRMFLVTLVYIYKNVTESLAINPVQLNFPMIESLCIHFIRSWAFAILTFAIKDTHKHQWGKAGSYPEYVVLYYPVTYSEITYAEDDVDRLPWHLAMFHPASSPALEFH